VSTAFRASRDAIIRTENFAAATRFYGEVPGLSLAYNGDNLIGFDAGCFRLYVEPSPVQGPVFNVAQPVRGMRRCAPSR
jgi:catechol 2,3-dioxygenase-like lactoylglutathione lyase family enzyme